MASERVHSTLEEIEAKTTQLMLNGEFLVEVAQACSDAYHLNLKEPTQLLYTEEERDRTVELLNSKQVIPSELNSRLAPNLAGFYALQGTVFAIAEDSNLDPLRLLEDIQSNDIRKRMGTMPQRAANTTWLVANAMKGRATSHEDVKVFNQLSVKTKSQDMAQVQAVAKVWYKALTTSK